MAKYAVDATLYDAGGGDPDTIERAQNANPGSTIYLAGRPWNLTRDVAPSSPPCNFVFDAATIIQGIGKMPPLVTNSFQRAGGTYFQQTFTGPMNASTFSAEAIVGPGSTGNVCGAFFGIVTPGLVAYNGNALALNTVTVINPGSGSGAAGGYELNVDNYQRSGAGFGLHIASLAAKGYDLGPAIIFHMYGPADDPGGPAYLQLLRGYNFRVVGNFDGGQQSTPPIAGFVFANVPQDVVLNTPPTDTPRPFIRSTNAAGSVNNIIVSTDGSAEFGPMGTFLRVDPGGLIMGGPGGAVVIDSDRAIRLRVRTTATLPTPGIPGREYFNVTTGKATVDNGAAWV
jgi:hypothetical protein